MTEKRGCEKMVICPQCGLEMENGKMEVHEGLRGIRWILLDDSEGASRDLIDSPNLKERIGKPHITGNTFPAERCRECDLILFKY
jgi:hypothetical protein